jgi:hypothetical protein
VVNSLVFFINRGTYETWKAFDELNQQSSQWAKIADKYKDYAHVVNESPCSLLQGDSL